MVDIALPPSPSFGSMNGAKPVPATVVIIPVLAVTFRTRYFNSEMYKFPDASTATLLGLDK